MPEACTTRTTFYRSVVTNLDIENNFGGDDLLLTLQQ